MEKFQLTLKNAKLKTYHLISWLLIFLNISVLYIVSFLEPGHYGDRFGITGILLLTLLLLFVKRTDRNNLPFKKRALLVINVLTSFIWIKWGMYIPAAATIFFGLLYLYSVRKFEVLVETSTITYPSFPEKKINWNELQNIVLKDGILTIDFRNNKVIQQELVEDDPVNEKDFNEFCTQLLHK